MTDTWNLAETEAWSTSTSSILPAGNYVCVIGEQPGKPFESESSGGYPMISMQLTGLKSEGEIRDWVVLSGQYGPQKLKQLLVCTGLEFPPELEAPPSPSFSALVAKLKGRKIGVIVRLEDDDRPEAKPGAKQSKVQGYVAPEEIGGTSGASDVPAPADAFTDPGSDSPQHTDDEIPF